MMQKSKFLTPQILLFIIVYMLITVTISVVNVLSSSVSIFGHLLESSDISVLLTMLMTLWIIVNMLADRELTYRTTLVLLVIRIGIIILGILKTHIVKIVPALFTVLFMYVISSIIYKHLLTIENKDSELQKLAYTDTVTNTPNKSAFNNLLKTLVENDEGNEKVPFALVLMDINQFTHICDMAGHNYGDILLGEIAMRWKFAMRSNDFIAHIGGDEFAIVIRDFKNENDLSKHINDFSDALKNKITIDEHSFFASVRMGFSMFPNDSTDPEELFRFADIAMQSVRDKKETHICKFEKNMISRIEHELIIENLLRDAISNDKFKLVFQPQYDTANKTIRGFETLLRLNDESGTPVSPGVFIPMAEKTGLITDIDCYVLKKAMETFLPMLKTYSEDLMLSVNISAVHLAKNNFVDDVKSAIEQTGFPPHNLEIEITESVAISSLANTAEILGQIKAMGIKIALDDFGTGYASLSYLTKLPIDLLKIDKTFVDGLQQENTFTDFVAAIISMGHLLHFDVISEGVEYEAQLNTLKKLKCDFIQGFLWGRPMDIGSVDSLLKTIC